LCVGASINNINHINENLLEPKLGFKT
jgi:hypothetical protein